jgi:transcription antitermination factor NusA-like protein
LAPVRVAVAVVVAEQVRVALGILGQLQRLIDRVQQVVSEIRSQIDQVCADTGRAQQPIAASRRAL